MANSKRSKPPAASPAGNILADQVDELGAIEARLLPYRADIAREDLLRKAIRQHFENSDPLKTQEIRGTKFLAVVGPRALQRSIDMVKLIKAIGLKAFAEIATVTLSALEKYSVSAKAPGLAADCVRQANTGPRSMNIFARPAA